MRLTEDQIRTIKQLAYQIAGEHARVRIFGSRLDDGARGGDLDLMLELPGPVDSPALLAARLAAKVSRLIHGRKVDVLISAPNLMRLPSTTWLSKKERHYDAGFPCRAEAAVSGTRGAQGMPASCKHGSAPV